MALLRKAIDCLYGMCYTSTVSDISRHLFWTKLSAFHSVCIPKQMKQWGNIFMRQEIDGIQFQMKEKFDFGFLRAYGKLFQVFDDQDGGNICFGMEKNNG